jgi:NAD+ kinase
MNQIYKLKINKQNQKGGVPILQRNRLKCKYEKCLTNNSNNSFNDEASSNSNHLTNKESQILSLNEIVISRGPSSFVTLLDLYVNDYLITTVQGDGLIISTPTGSTAYAMAAGASMSHPALPAIIITPICPHSLSFRPIVVPANVVLKITLGSEARDTAWFSVDGRANKELKHGHNIIITTSEYPLMSICRNDQITDWFSGLVTNLHWNQRNKQLPLNSCYLRSDIDLQSPRSHSSFSSETSSSTASSSTTQISSLLLDNNNSTSLNVNKNNSPDSKVL